MKVLVIGQGGREHALVHSFSLSPRISEVHAIPGNDGMKAEALCHDLDWKNFEAIVQFCLRTEIDFVFIGPEEPLVAGLSDELRARGILVVGASRSAANLEGSKIVSKRFMTEMAIPTAAYEIVTSVDETVHAAEKFSAPFVLKADGLAAGKGVYICANLEELHSAAVDLFEKKILGAAGEKALLEKFQPGWELSFLVLTNGQDFQALPLAQDHKRLRDNDEGPNTGGMGTVAPFQISAELRREIEEKIIRPTLAGLQKHHILYRGVLYFGLMMTADGASLLEYNCRFGDPETQVILPLIQNDVAELFLDLAKGKLQTVRLHQRSAACVVMAAPGYPRNPEKNISIEGDPLESTPLSYFLHAATLKTNEGWKTNGGRVLNAVGLGSTLQEALRNAYLQASKVKWRGLQMRRDIGLRISCGS